MKKAKYIEDLTIKQITKYLTEELKSEQLVKEDISISCIKPNTDIYFEVDPDGFKVEGTDYQKAHIEWYEGNSDETTYSGSFDWHIFERVLEIIVYNGPKDTYDKCDIF
jgi:hypothetical protein